MTANRRIVLNIAATYFRSLYALALGLFTARWALQALGQIDYGLMGVVGGMTAFLVYFNSILGGAVGRFYALSVGREKAYADSGLEECRKWFTTAVVIHTLIPTLALIIGYPIGVHAVRYWLTIPPDRIEASVWVWRFVCASCFLSMVTIPLSAMYTAKQYIAELTVYSFATSTLNAVFLYYMITHPGIWLTKYAFWQCVLGILPSLIIGVRAMAIFPECRIRARYLHCWNNIKTLAGYALWNAWGGLGALIREQGSSIVVNLFFGPKVNAGLAIGNSVSGQCSTLTSSMIGAFSPAIFNEWGAANFDRARKMAFQTCKLGTLFILMFAIPLCLEIDEVLHLWLKEPPMHAAGFCIFVLCMNVVDKMAIGHMIVVNANGKVALYQAFLGTSLILTLPLSVLLVKCGLGPYSVGWALVGTMIVCACGRVVFARRLVAMSASYWLRCIAAPLLGVSLAAVLIGLLPRFWLAPSFVRICVTTVLVECMLLPTSWFALMNRDERSFVMSRVLILRGKAKGLIRA